MDYSKFLDDEFDAKEWVNSAFRNYKDGNNDQYATTLVMKLQMFIQEVNNVIEDSCHQAVNNLPRVTRELEAVKQESSLLQEQMKMVKYDIQKVEHDTAASMHTLLKLDTVKSRLKATADALREADNWTTLSTDVDDVFDSQDIEAIAKKLIGMQQSLHILTDVPDYLERCQYLETLKNRLEAMLSPHVVSAFSAQSLDAAQRFAKIFGDIERHQQLCKYYHKCHRGQLQQEWRAIQQDATLTSLADSLDQFYNNLLTVWQTQIKWCAQVFSDPASIVCDLLTETLIGLDPPMTLCIDGAISKSKTPLDVLISLRQTTERFVSHLEAAFETPSLSGILYQPCVEKLAAAIYAPYKDYIKNYSKYEETVLSAALDVIRLDHEDILECVGLLGDSVPKLFAAANTTNQRCAELTSGCGYIALTQTLHDYFHHYLTEFERVVVNIREKCKLDSLNIDDSDEWGAFQNSLRIIQTCGDLILHIEEFDQLVVSNIISTVGKYFISTVSPQHRDTAIKLELKKNPFRNYKMLLVDHNADRQALDTLVKHIEDGENASVMEGVKEDIYMLSAHVHKFTFDIVFAPLQHHLTHVPNMQVWSTENHSSALTTNLPAFSLAPQEYITKIGQYLMTLPQQLEPFTMEDNPMLTVALKHGKLPYTADIGDLPEHLADLWLESVARGTMHIYSDQILKIHILTELATKQLVTDIDYLTNVLDDLGLQASEMIKTIVSLLQATQDQYSELAENSPQRLSSAIANIRRLRLI